VSAPAFGVDVFRSRLFFRSIGLRTGSASPIKEHYYRRARDRRWSRGVFGLAFVSNTEDSVPAIHVDEKVKKIRSEGNAPDCLAQELVD
jgi:hypothetical protein